MNDQGHRTGYTLTQFFADVYMHLGYGLAVCGISALVMAQTPGSLELVARISLLLAAVMFGICMYIQWNHALSAYSLLCWYTAFSCLEGIQLSLLFHIYTQSSIASVFLISAGIFLASGLYGARTGDDLTSYVTVARLVLGGVIVTSILGMIFQLHALHFIINFVVAAICPILIAGASQELKTVYYTYPHNTLPVRGAFQLFVLFINLFLSLLNLFGTRRRD
jgi:hypothetical protein